MVLFFLRFVKLCFTIAVCCSILSFHCVLSKDCLPFYRLQDTNFLKENNYTYVAWDNTNTNDWTISVGNGKTIVQSSKKFKVLDSFKSHQAGVLFISRKVVYALYVNPTRKIGLQASSFQIKGNALKENVLHIQQYREVRDVTTETFELFRILGIRDDTNDTFMVLTENGQCKKILTRTVHDPICSSVDQNCKKKKAVGDEMCVGIMGMNDYKLVELVDVGGYLMPKYHGIILCNYYQQLKISPKVQTFNGREYIVDNELHIFDTDERELACFDIPPNHKFPLIWMDDWDSTSSCAPFRIKVEPPLEVAETKRGGMRPSTCSDSNLIDFMPLFVGVSVLDVLLTFVAIIIVIVERAGKSRKHRMGGGASKDKKKKKKSSDKKKKKKKGKKDEEGGGGAKSNDVKTADVNVEVPQEVKK